MKCAYKDDFTNCNLDERSIVHSACYPHSQALCKYCVDGTRQHAQCHDFVNSVKHNEIQVSFQRGFTIGASQAQAAYEAGIKAGDTYQKGFDAGYEEGLRVGYNNCFEEYELD
jgi:recombinational DNA repair protein (RecF pathway)